MPNMLAGCLRACRPLKQDLWTSTAGHDSGESALRIPSTMPFESDSPGRSAPADSIEAAPRFIRCCSATASDDVLGFCADPGRGWVHEYQVGMFSALCLVLRRPQHGGNHRAWGRPTSEVGRHVAHALRMPSSISCFCEWLLRTSPSSSRCAPSCASMSVASSCAGDRAEPVRRAQG